MPRTQSAKKALRQNLRRRTANLERKNALRTDLKKFQKLVSQGKATEARQYLPKIYKGLDKIAKVNLIKYGRANRLKSRLAKKIKG